MWKLIPLCTLVGLATAYNMSFNKYVVLELLPLQQEQLEYLHSIKSDGINFSFWKPPSSIDNTAHLMVAPDLLDYILNKLHKYGIPYKTYIDNVQELIDRSTPKNLSHSFDFTGYHTLAAIYENLHDLVEQYPDNVQTIIGGQTHEGWRIKGVKVSYKPNNPGVFIEGGIHGREWISPAAVMYLLHQLLNSTNADVRNMAENYDWYIFPSFNPDGYVYTQTTNRMWKKNRHEHKLYGSCFSTDLNRNWGYKWTGSEKNLCTESYSGENAFSELETSTMSDYIKHIKDKFFAYFSFTTYSRFLLLPYGYTHNHMNLESDQYDIIFDAIKVLIHKHNTFYWISTIADAYNITTGSTLDYIKGTYQKPLVLGYQIDDSGKYGFLHPPEEIIPIGEKIVDFLVAVLSKTKELGIHRQ
ncbi:zinc carboxypeptidase [Harpegnathos saltator]|uniref:Zinc carboxypeptidase A 1 n=1 Tax=Harpegnathos saltator TaxID=610380 RepID=E2BM38_HARSA|nr:zinc carboxypeptidase [Harpegnathos saltator]EFN83244.1 Zinc carboxypeptidase A 1 [Harpegnathos saltator]